MGRPENSEFNQEAKQQEIISEHNQSIARLKDKKENKQSISLQELTALLLAMKNITSHEQYFATVTKVFDVLNEEVTKEKKIWMGLSSETVVVSAPILKSLLPNIIALFSALSVMQKYASQAINKHLPFEQHYANPSKPELQNLINRALSFESDELVYSAAQTIYEQVLSESKQESFKTLYLEKLESDFIPVIFSSDENIEKTPAVYKLLVFKEAKEKVILHIANMLQTTQSSEYPALSQLCLLNWPQELDNSFYPFVLFQAEHTVGLEWDMATRAAVLNKLDESQRTKFNKLLPRQHMIARNLGSELSTPSDQGNSPGIDLAKLAKDLASSNEQTRKNAKEEYSCLKELSPNDQDRFDAKYRLEVEETLNRQLVNADVRTHQVLASYYADLLPEVPQAKTQFEKQYLETVKELINNTFSKDVETRKSSVELYPHLAFTDAKTMYFNVCSEKIREFAESAFSPDHKLRTHSIAVAKSFESTIPEVFAVYKNIYDANVAAIAAETFSADLNTRSEAIAQSSYIAFEDAQTAYENACKEKVESIAKAAAQITDINTVDQVESYVREYEALPTKAMKQAFIRCYIQSVDTPATAFFPICLENWPEDLKNSHEKLVRVVTGYVLATPNSETAAWSSKTLDNVFRKIQDNQELTKQFEDTLEAAGIEYGFDRPADAENQPVYYSGLYVSKSELHTKYGHGNSDHVIRQLVAKALAATPDAPIGGGAQGISQKQRQEKTILYIYEKLLTSQEQELFNRVYDDSITKLANVIFDKSTSEEQRELCFAQAGQLKDEHALKVFIETCQQNARDLATLAFDSSKATRDKNAAIGKQLGTHPETYNAYRVAYIERAKKLAEEAFHPTQTVREQCLEIYTSFAFPEATAAFVHHYVSTFNDPGSNVIVSPAFAQVCVNNWPIDQLDSQVLLKFCTKLSDSICWDLQTLQNVYSKLANDEDRKILNRVIDVQIESDEQAVAIFGFNHETQELLSCSNEQLQELMATANNIVEPRGVAQQDAEMKIANIISWAGPFVLDAVFKNFWRDATAEEKANIPMSSLHVVTSFSSQEVKVVVNKINYSVLAAGLHSIQEQDVISEVLQTFIQAMPSFNEDKGKVEQPQVLSFTDFWRFLNALSHATDSSEEKLKNALELLKHNKITVRTAAELRTLVSIFSGQGGLNYKHALRLMLDLYHGVSVSEAQVTADARKNGVHDQYLSDFNTWTNDIGVKVDYYDRSEQGEDPNFSKYLKRLENKFPAGDYDELQYIFKLAILVHDQNIGKTFGSALISILTDSSTTTGHSALPDHDETRYMYGQFRKLICQALPIGVLTQELGDRLPHLFNYTPFANFTSDELATLQTALSENTIKVPSKSMGISGSSDKIKKHILALDPNDSGYKHVPFEKYEVEKIGQLLQKYRATLGFREDLSLPNLSFEQAQAQLERLDKVTAAAANEQAAEIFAKVFLTRILPASMDVNLGRTAVGPKVSNKAFLATLCYLLTSCVDNNIAERLYFYTHNLVTASEQDLPESDRVSVASGSTNGSASSIISTGSFTAHSASSISKKMPGRSGMKPKNQTSRMRTAFFGKSTPLTTIDASPGSGVETPSVNDGKTGGDNAGGKENPTPKKLF